MPKDEKSQAGVGRGREWKKPRPHWYHRVDETVALSFLPPAFWLCEIIKRFIV